MIHKINLTFFILLFITLSSSANNYNATQTLIMYDVHGGLKKMDTEQLDTFQNDLDKFLKIMNASELVGILRKYFQTNQNFNENLCNWNGFECYYIWQEIQQVLNNEKEIKKLKREINELSEKHCQSLAEASERHRQSVVENKHKTDEISQRLQRYMMFYQEDSKSLNEKTQKLKEYEEELKTIHSELDQKERKNRLIQREHTNELTLLKEQINSVNEDKEEYRKKSVEHLWYIQNHLEKEEKLTKDLSREKAEKESSVEELAKMLVQLTEERVETKLWKQDMEEDLTREKLEKDSYVKQLARMIIQLNMEKEKTKCLKKDLEDEVDYEREEKEYYMYHVFNMVEEIANQQKTEKELRQKFTDEEEENAKMESNLMVQKIKDQHDAQEYAMSLEFEVSTFKDLIEKLSVEFEVEQMNNKSLNEQVDDQQREITTLNDLHGFIRVFHYQPQIVEHFIDKQLHEQGETFTFINVVPDGKFDTIKSFSSELCLSMAAVLGINKSLVRVVVYLDGSDVVVLWTLDGDYNSAFQTRGFQIALDAQYFKYKGLVDAMDVPKFILPTKISFNTHHLDTKKNEFKLINDKTTAVYTIEESDTKKYNIYLNVDQKSPSILTSFKTESVMIELVNDNEVKYSCEMQIDKTVSGDSNPKGIIPSGLMHIIQKNNNLEFQQFSYKNNSFPMPHLKLSYEIKKYLN